MLKIEDLSYRYLSRHKFTLKKINLQLAEGEMLLLAGRSGCGKSTLLQCIGLLDKPTSGDIFIGGVPIDKMNDEEIMSLINKLGSPNIKLLFSL